MAETSRKREPEERRSDKPPFERKQFLIPCVYSLSTILSCLRLPITILRPEFLTFIFLDFPEHLCCRSSVRVYVTYVFYLCLPVCACAPCKASRDVGCLRSALVATAEEIKLACVSRQCCRFISLLTALVLLPIHRPPLAPVSFFLSLSILRLP